jgi:hypothetical protein
MGLVAEEGSVGSRWRDWLYFCFCSLLVTWDDRVIVHVGAAAYEDPSSLLQLQ